MRLRVLVRGMMARFLSDFLLRQDVFLRRAILVRIFSAFSRISVSSSSIYQREQVHMLNWGDRGVTISSSES